MKERLISIYKNTTYRTVATYVFVLFFSRGVSFLLLPLFTNPKYLTPADNGMLSIFSSNLILLTPFITLGLVQSSSRDFFAIDEESFKKSFTQNIIIALVMMVLVIGFLLLFKDYFNNKLHINGMLLFIIPLLIYLTLFNDMFLTILRNKNEVRFFSIINICKTILEYGASVLLVVFLYKGWYGRVGGIIVAALTINFISLFYLWKKQYLRFDFKLKHISEELKFSFPIILFQLCVFMLGLSNKAFLAFFKIDEAEIGIYAIATIFGAMVGGFSYGASYYTQPQLYKAFKEEGISYTVFKPHLLRFIKLVSIITLGCIITVLFLYYFFINKLYIKGIGYFFVGAAASYLWSINNFYFQVLIYSKWNRKMLYLTVLSLLLSFTTRFIMVKYFGIWGDVWSTFLSTVFFTVLIFIFLNSFIRQKEKINTTVISK